MVFVFYIPAPDAGGGPPHIGRGWGMNGRGLLSTWPPSSRMGAQGGRWGKRGVALRARVRGAAGDTLGNSTAGPPPRFPGEGDGEGDTKTATIRNYLPQTTSPIVSHAEVGKRRAGVSLASLTVGLPINAALS